MLETLLVYLLSKFPNKAKSHVVTATTALIKFSSHSETKVVRAMPYVSLSRNLSINKVLGIRSNSVTIN